MKTVLVCFAVKEESAPFRRLASERADIHILITGMGKKNAESKVGAFLEQCHPQCVLTCGFAGGLNPQLALGDVVFATNDARLRETLSQAGARPATCHCASRVAVTVAEKAELRGKTGADAVEMESEAIQLLCRAKGIPCATVRVISDTANEGLPLDFNALASADQSLNYRKLALAIARSPGKIPALMRLGQNTKLAAARLADVLAKVVSLR